jgi:hypothetical protein
VGAKKYKVKATAPLEYVSKLQADLITLGYLAAGDDDGYFGGKSKRALTRFQRHARRLYRMKADPAGNKADDVKAADAFAGSVTGACDLATAKEIRKWIDKSWRLPLSRFPLKDLTEGGKLREDAADAWEEIVKKATEKGATLEGVYGDTLRPLRKTTKSGTSKHSFHYCGRAVDITQSLSDWGDARRYYVAKDAAGTDMYWRIWCKAEKQDGTQGEKVAKNAKDWWDFSDKKARKIPEGYYVDLTTLIESTDKFERIKAQSNWESDYNKSEWWHFQYKIDKQETFGDEIELIGKTEKDARDADWSDAELDHAPG